MLRYEEHVFHIRVTSFINFYALYPRHFTFMRIAIRQSNSKEYRISVFDDFNGTEALEQFRRKFCFKYWCFFIVITIAIACNFYIYEEIS